MAQLLHSHNQARRHKHPSMHTQASRQRTALTLRNLHNLDNKRFTLITLVITLHMQVSRGLMPDIRLNQCHSL
jgi:hypothetical protein